MKKILVTVVLGIAVAAAGARSSAQSTQGQPAASSSQAPVIKDPAEYNAYVGAIQQKEPAAQISGLEAFLTQYPNSVMKTTALEVLMGDYQQTNNVAKATETAQKLVALDPCNDRALALLAYFDRVRAQGGDPNAKQLLQDADKYGEEGEGCLSKFTKTDNTSEAEFEKLKAQMNGIFSAAVGISALQDKDYAKAAKNLKVAVDLSPQDFSVVYPLALAYLQSTPPDSINGIWYAARASVVAPAQVQASIEKYAKNQYHNYHGGDDGWTDVLAAAKANPAPPAGFTIKPAPTPAEQVHAMVLATSPDKMDFGTWEFVLTNGSQEDKDTVWNAIKGKAVQMNGMVISTTPTEFQIAGSEDDIEAKKPDITLQFVDKVPPKMIPKDGSSFDFQGEPASYTTNPFMMTMANGKLLKAATPAKRPVHHRPSN
ncbi:MAG TPA: hypothetical protein VMU61_02985 [Candidatus Aquilonibacter sp.]|nr:hypothetical protein [Candidatus Aquilonibacter sp.]